MSRIIFTSLSGVTPLNIYVSDVLGGHETYLGEITTLPLVSDVFFDLPETFNASPQITIILEDIYSCRQLTKLNCYIDCDIIYDITDVTLITPTPTPTPSSTPGYIPAPVTNNTITLTSVTGLLPLSVYISDINGNYNTYVGSITNATVLPISFDIPTIFEETNQVILTISDANSCSYFKIIDCGITYSLTPTPSNSATPTITPSISVTNTNTPTPTITSTPNNTNTPTPTITPTITPTNNTNVFCTPIIGCKSESTCDCGGNPSITVYYSGIIDINNNPSVGVFYETLSNCQTSTYDFNITGYIYFVDTTNQLYWQPDINGEINGYNICL